MARAGGSARSGARLEGQPGLLLDALGLLVRDAEALRDGVGDVGAAHQQDAHEARDPALVDHDVGDVGADVDEGLGLGRLQPGRVHRHQRAQDGEGGEVDHLRGEAGLLNGEERAVDHVARGGDEQDAQHAAAGLVGELLERVEVQDGLLHRHRDVVLHLEGQGLLQLARRQPRQVDLADDDLLVRDADDDLLGGELRLRPELLDGLGDSVGVDDLAVPHRAGRQRHLTEPLERCAALAERQLGSAHAGCPDVETHDSACHCLSPR